MRNKPNLFLCSLGFLVITPHAIAETIQPDRPGLATGTYTVNPGRYIVETGIQTDFRRDGAKQSLWAVPQFTLRGGITQRLEWDVIWNGAELSDAQGIRSEWSVSDVSVGGKYSLFESESTNISALGVVSVPVGTSPSTSDSVDPLIGVLWDHALSDSVSLFGVVQGSTFEHENERLHDMQFALGATFSHSDQLATFVEYFATKPYGDLPSTSIVDAGVTYLLNSQLQFDVSAGVGLNNDTDHFIGAGIAWAF